VTMVRVFLPTLAPAGRLVPITLALPGRLFSPPASRAWPFGAVARLGEESPASEQAGRTLVPRCVKDLIEERLFARRRDLFSDLSVAFMDTTSLYFEGRGGETLGQNGHSKDYRPHLKQMIVGIIMDQDGRPVRRRANRRQEFAFSTAGELDRNLLVFRTVDLCRRQCLDEIDRPGNTLL
jgi:hypothetical protein